MGHAKAALHCVSKPGTHLALVWRFLETVGLVRCIFLTGILKLNACNNLYKNTLFLCDMKLAEDLKARSVMAPQGA